MASYNGTVVLSGMISPTDTTDSYPTHEDTLGKGGYMSVADIAARDNIPSLRRKEGMMVYVVSDETLYQLKSGIDNTNWSDFVTGGAGEVTTPESLQQSSMSVSGLINGIFDGSTIPTNQVAYVRGNDGIIDSVVRFDSLTNVLNDNVYNDFIIINNGTSSTVYYNNTVHEAHIQEVIDNFPMGYDSVNLTINPLSNKISNLLSQTYTSGIQFYAVTGIIARIEKGTSTFDVINQGEDFIVTYNGSTYFAFKKHSTMLADLQARLILG